MQAPMQLIFARPLMYFVNEPESSVAPCDSGLSAFGPRQYITRPNSLSRFNLENQVSFLGLSGSKGIKTYSAQ